MSLVASADTRQIRAHAALIADDGAWAQLPARIAADPVLARVAEATRARVRAHLAAPATEHVMEGQRRLTSARLFLGRILDLATVARLGRDARAAARARDELLAVAAMPCWNPDHFLDVGEYALGAAIGLAWLRDALTEAEAERVATALIDRALRPSYEGTPFMLRWLGGTSNWTQVCHAGLVAAALAVADREPELAARTVARAIAEQEGPARAYAPDGAYVEGPTYWGYGTSFHVVLVSLLEGATGSDHGLASYPGFLESADYLAHMIAPTGRFFNYGDSRESVPALPVLHWFAARRGDPAIAAVELRRLEAGARDLAGELRAVYERLDSLALWWHRPSGRASAVGSARSLPLRWFGGGETPVGVARTGWGDPRAAYLGIKGGRASSSHAHLDAGAFVYEAGGVRWAIDPGMQDYHSLESLGVRLWDGSTDGERWRVFRLGLESHNVMRFEGAPTSVEAGAELSDAGERFEVDLAPLHAPVLAAMTRSAALAADGALTIEDRWTTTGAPVVARWQWLTRARVERAADGVVLRQDGQALRLRVTGAEPAAWSIVVEEAADLLAAYDEPCPGLSRVTIRVPTPAGSGARLRVEARLCDEAKP